MDESALEVARLEMAKPVALPTSLKLECVSEV
jgi:hypothetical protein